MLTTADDLVDDVANWPIPVILDVRWQLGDPLGRRHYYNGHIPGALFADLPSQLSAHPNKHDGRHPLPDPANFEASCRKWGIDNNSRVVVYDDTNSMSAARAWWLLRWSGLHSVSILDGGAGAWREQGGDFAVGPGNLVPAGDFDFELDHMLTIDADEAGKWPEHGVLLDVRAAPRYRGDVEPVDKRPGHIPGAVNLPTATNIAEDGSFRSAEQLRESFASVGIGESTDVAVYCGSGVHACHTIAALEIAGYPGAKLYAGSWSQWSSDYSRPVKKGDQP